MAETFEVNVERSDRVGTVRVTGEFDLAVAQQVENALLSLEDGSSDVIVLDLRGVSFLDSTGLRVLTSADARARKDGIELRIVRGTERVQQLLYLTALDKILPLVDNPEEAPSSA